MSIDTVDLVERLRHPLWVHSDFGSPQLEKETTEIDLAQAADTIEQYRADAAYDECTINFLKARAEQAERAVDVLEAALRESRGELTKLAAECHRAKWQFDFNDENRLPVGQARDMVNRAFGELHRIGDLALKALESRP